MEGLRRPTKSRQGAKPDSAKPTQVGSSTRRLSCVARQRLPIPSILSILSHSTPHPQPPHLYKCGGSHAANNEGPRSELRFATIESFSVKTSATFAPALHPRLLRPARHMPRGNREIKNRRTKQPEGILYRTVGESFRSARQSGRSVVRDVNSPMTIRESSVARAEPISQNWRQSMSFCSPRKSPAALAILQPNRQLCRRFGIDGMARLMV